MLDNVNEERAALLKNSKSKYYGANVTTGENEIRYSSSCLRLPIPFSPPDDGYGNGSINADNFSDSEDTVNWSASLSRYRYYLRLGVPVIPDHVLPSRFFVLLPSESIKPGTQSSFVTIFSIWNTMMGTSLLSMPWAIQQSGFALGIFLMMLVGALAFYTAYLVLQSIEDLPLEPGRTAFNSDFSDACRFYLGKTGEIVSIVFSFLALLSGMVVYYVLLCNFLYFTINYLHGFIINKMNLPQIPPITIYDNHTDVICPTIPYIVIHNTSLSNFSFYETLFLSGSIHSHSSNSIFGKLWSQTHTVPFWLLIIILPLVSIKSPTFFTKFNALGTISVAYLFLLVFIKVVKWGIHMDFNSTTYPSVIPNARGTFIVLTGIGSLAFFIHNAIHSIVRNQAKPQNNVRDLLIAYICVAITYLGIGILFYISFPFAKDCIQDNLLNNLSENDLLAFIARVSLFFQMLTVLPLLMYILRTQFMYFFFKKFYPSWFHVFILHIVLLIICISFSVFMPHIGEIARFSGSICGFVYMFALPALVNISKMHKQGKFVSWSLIFHISLIIVGLLNFLGQFVSYFENY
uniref:Slc38a-2 n=1 Tax=Schmidtea mediterranea TaxID=79327 RepID=A0A0H3YJE4_SCHMD|nr:slc38a-2 [Schmidtea mediterranea]